VQCLMFTVHQAHVDPIVDPCITDCFDLYTKV